MTAANTVRLLALAAIWGASFLFFRMAVPSLGAVWLAELRVSIAALVMLACVLATGSRLDVRRHWRAYLMMGVLNAALPWTLYAYAGLHLGAGTMAILNATTPFFGAICGALWLGEPFTARKLGGLLLGVVGVALVVGLGPIALTPGVALGVAACVGATLCYAVSATWLKKLDRGAPPLSLTTANLVVASFAIAPFLPAVPPAAAFTAQVIVAVLGVSLLCSALAFLLFFRLIAEIGATRTLTVTFLIPVFGVFWGWLFLGEAIGAGTIAGGLTVLAATALVIRR
jgi:drug/metabolite transporter (DMT)-like permease